jgi:16S rRNA (guanine(966)-N(2))-methyltransferase RsmD
MLDRVREALFSTVQDWLEDGRVLDLFAGSGSLGIEALSRGAARARLVERNPKTAALLSANLEALELAKRAQVVVGDALERGSWGKRSSADLILFDPPYPLLEDPNSRTEVLAAVACLACEVLRPKGMLVFHAARRAVTQGAFDPRLSVEERRYGTNSLWYVQRDEGATP